MGAYICFSKCKINVRQLRFKFTIPLHMLLTFLIKMVDYFKRALIRNLL